MFWQFLAHFSRTRSSVQQTRRQAVNHRTFILEEMICLSGLPWSGELEAEELLDHCAPFDFPPDLLTETDSPLGVFEVSEAGLIEVDFLYDDEPMQEGEVGIFSVAGLDPSAEDFETRALTRANSDSCLGRIVISETTEGTEPTFNEALNRNSGHRAINRVRMRPGDRIGMVIVPQGSIAQALEVGSTTFFSIESANDFENIHFVSWGDSNIISIEVSPFGETTGNFLDVVLRFEGVEDINLPEIAEIDDRPDLDLQQNLFAVVMDLDSDGDQIDTPDPTPEETLLVADKSEELTPGPVTPTQPDLDNLPVAEPNSNIPLNSPEPHPPVIEPKTPQPETSVAETDLPTSLEKTNPEPIPDENSSPQTPKSPDPSDKQRNPRQSFLDILLGKLLIQKQSDVEILLSPAQPSPTQALEPSPPEIPPLTPRPRPRPPKLPEVNLEPLTNPKILLPLMSQGLFICGVAESDILFWVQHKVVWIVDVDGTISCFIQLTENISALVSETAILLWDLKHGITTLIGQEIVCLFTASGQMLVSVGDWIALVGENTVSLTKVSGEFIVSLLDQIISTLYLIFNGTDDGSSNSPQV